MNQDRTPAATREMSLEVVLDYLKRARGFDFTGYKRTSLERRLRKRMQDVGVESYGDYLDHLEVHPDEFSALFDTILINVTSFFRDPPAWEYLAQETIPALLDEIGRDVPIRVWCAGCSTGEETYTLAMALAEAIGVDEYLRRVKIYATEVDDEALAQAREGTYTAKQVESVPAALLDRYFERGDLRYSFRKDMRRTLIFGRNDLTQDAPISRIDLLVCRNTLMYFNAEMQGRIVARFHFALNPWGFLFLGKSEMLITHPDLFRPTNLKRRVFRKVAKATLRDRLAAFTLAGDPQARPVDDLRDATFDGGPTAQIVVDPESTLVLVNAQARALFKLGPDDIGRPLRDLEVSYRPVDLRSKLDIVFKENRAVTIAPVASAPTSGDPRALEVHIAPLRAGERTLGATILFLDVTRQRGIEEELDAARRALENAYEELQSTVEELETTNEELQSTVEELETTNEELQSANEELETMNEELQSTNEELETMNDELRERSLELNDSNTFLETILSSLEVAVIAVDGDQTVRAWNDESADLWGLRADEATGRQLLALDIGLPMDGVRDALRSVLSDGQVRAGIEVDATDRRGRSLAVRVTCMPLKIAAGAVSGAVLLTADAGGSSGDGAG